MADNPSSADRTSQNSGSQSPNAPTTNGALLSGKKERDENVGLFLLALVLVATAWALFFLRIEPAGTWGVAIIGAGALVLAVLTLSRVFPQSFWDVLVAGAVLVYVISLAYQAGTTQRALSQQVDTTRLIAVNTTPVVLGISYPGQAPLEKVDQPGLPLFVYIRGATATPASTPPATQMPTATVVSVAAGAPTGASSASPTATLTVTPTATPTVTPTPTGTPYATITATGRMSLTLAFLPQSDGLVFSDQEGGPVAPQIAIRGADEAPLNAALFVRRSSAYTDTSPISVTMMLRTNSQPTDWQPLGTISIDPESTFTAWWRNFLGLLLGPTTPILALVGTLLGFGWQWWQDRKRKEEEERKSRMVKIEEARSKIYDDPDEARRTLDYLEGQPLMKADPASVALIGEVRIVLDEHVSELQRKERIKKIEEILITASSKPSQAAREFVAVFRRAQSENWGTDFHAMLQQTRIRLDDYPWQDELLAEAICALGKDPLEPNSIDGTIKDFSVLVPETPEVTDLELFANIVKDLGKEQGKQDEKKPAKISDKVNTILRVLQRYGDAIRPVSVRILAWLAGQPETISEVKNQLAASPFGRELLQEHEFEDPLLELAKSERQEISQEANDLLTLRRRQTGRWLRLWPESRQADLTEVSRWLSSVGLAFNPFGPEAGELDPFLEKYVIPTPFEDARGPLPTIIFGASGSGKTTAALTIAHDCNDPPDSPREAAAFPVYYPLQMYQDANVSSVTHVEALATAIARALVGYLGTNPNGFLQLPMSRQKQMSRLLLATFGSVEHLYSALRTAGSLYSANRIRAEIGRLEVERLSTGAASVTDWLLLLDQPMPSQFERVYAFVDVSSRLTPSATEHVIEQLTTLVDLLIPLAARQVILKFFVPSRLERYLGNVHGCRRVFLRWDEDLLRQLLEARMKQARGSDYGFNALFGPGGLADPSGQLARACAASKGPPRRLVALGNELIYRHVMRPGASRELDIREFETMLRMEHPQR